MKYVRTWRFSSSHLNNQAAYNVVWDLTLGRDQSSDRVLEAMRDTHGHNYKVVVVIEGMLREGWLVDDPELENVLKPFMNTNISLHPFFLASRKRATTEELAILLWGHFVQVAAQYNCRVDRVEVWETDDIYAIYEPPVQEYVNMTLEQFERGSVADIARS